METSVNGQVRFTYPALRGGIVDVGGPENLTNMDVVRLYERHAGRPAKVNHRDGNPIEISAVFVWRVVNTAEALFEVDDYEDFVAVQSEAALRNMATSYPYDTHEENVIALRSHVNEIAEKLKREVQDRLALAWQDVEVVIDRVHAVLPSADAPTRAPEIALASVKVPTNKPPAVPPGALFAVTVLLTMVTTPS